MSEPDIPLINPLHRATGEAIEAYARVEGTLASLLEAILKVDMLKAHAILFAIQNTRSRNELFQTLLTLQFKKDIRKYWASCGGFLLVLSKFQNAIAHWHPHINIYVTARVDGDPSTRWANALGHPVPGTSFNSIEAKDFPPFLKDCKYIREELSALIALVKEPPATLPEKLLKPIVHRNQALLQPRRTAKGQKPQHQSSPRSAPRKPRKPSAKQRRMRALSKRRRA